MATRTDEITVEAKLEEIDTVHQFIEDFLLGAGFPEDLFMNIDVAVEELFANVANYAYGGKTGSATIRVSVEDAPPVAIVILIDHGLPFNPLAREEMKVSNKKQDIKIGGRGIFLVKKLMDNFAYEYKDGNNIVTIRKKFQPVRSIK